MALVIANHRTPPWAGIFSRPVKRMRYTDTTSSCSSLFKRFVPQPVGARIARRPFFSFFFFPPPFFFFFFFFFLKKKKIIATRPIPSSDGFLKGQAELNPDLPFFYSFC